MADGQHVMILAALDDVPVRFDRGTPFQHEVWNALRTIPVGQTISYAELALRVGQRRVGAVANRLADLRRARRLADICSHERDRARPVQRLVV